eukprot:scaffold6265_cov120-Skeletonema_marinoi.AAC.11
MRNEIESLADVTVSDLLQLKKPHSERLKAFIHARKFNCREFKQSQLTGTNGKLNLMMHKNQSAESIEADCSEEAPCLFWYAWKLRSNEIVLSARDVPVLDIPMVLPQFTVTSARPTMKKLPSEYLSDPVWLDALSSAVKGAAMISVSEELRMKADYLCSSLEGRLSCHISGDRVDRSKQNHWTLRLFTRENLPAMAAAICIFGHIVDDDITTYGMDDCLLRMPMSQSEGFFLIDGNNYVGTLQGCYLYFDWTKFRWIRSGKTSGDGIKACFRGRGDTHKKNAKSVVEMEAHPFYRFYPAKGVETIGVRKGHFDDLSMYCGMAFDPSESDGVSNICSDGEIGSLFVWSKEVMRELNKKEGELRKVQLDAISICGSFAMIYCWPRVQCSASPGFESLGLRVNRSKKRKTYD